MNREWTGYTDKNGVPICVGDHVRSKYGVVSIIGKERIGDGSEDEYFGMVHDRELRPGEIPSIMTFHYNPDIPPTLEVIKIK